MASSFIKEVAADSDIASTLSVLASSEVDDALVRAGTDRESFAGYRVHDSLGITALWRGLPIDASAYDAVFTVFGPVYAPVRQQQITGMAQAWIIYPRNPAYDKLPALLRMRTRLKFFLQMLFFSKSDVFIVEQEHVRRGLQQKRLFRNKPIHVVPNTVDSIFFDRGRWEPVALPSSSNRLKLGVVARPHIHKNLEILPSVRKLLAQRHGIDADVFVTLTDSEWEQKDSEFRRELTNVGSLRLGQVPTFLSAMDGVVFPSLLESFSASPLEALAVGRPLFASDLPFVRDTVGGQAALFDPMDAASCAEVIADYVKGGEQAGTPELPESLGWTARDRAKAYVSILRAAIGDDGVGCGRPPHIPRGGLAR